MVVGRWGSDGLALGAGMEGLKAERRVLPAGQPRHGALPAAKPLFHGFGILAAKQLGAIQTAEGIKIVAVNKVFGILLLAVVEVVPGAQQFPPIGLGQRRIDLGPRHALGRVGVGQGHSLQLS